MDYQKSFENYKTLIDSCSGLELKGKTMPYTSINGHMCSFLDKDGVMGLRLGEDDREAFIKEHKSQLMEQHGRIMKEYVVVPDKLLMNTKKLSNYLKRTLDYVTALKPKPSKKK